MKKKISLIFFCLLLLQNLVFGQCEKLLKGKNKALVIGISNYEGVIFTRFPNLPNAVNDAKEVAEVLKSNYNFEVITLLDKMATGDNILKELQYLVKNSLPEDNVLIYFSGHGELDRVRDLGMLVPAIAANEKDLIPHINLIYDLGEMKAKHVLLVADACYAGDIFEAADQKARMDRVTANSEKFYQRSSRQAITAGKAGEKVLDRGMNGHSYFTYYFLEYLKANQNSCLPISEIDNYVYSRLGIEKAKDSMVTKSRFGNLKSIKGDEGGEFLFFKHISPKLRIGMEPEAPPMNFRENGLRRGFDVELAMLIAQNMDMDTFFVEKDYNELSTKLANKKLDIILGGYVAHPSIEKVMWSDPYLKTSASLIVKKGSAIKEIKHLNGKKVGIYDDPFTEEWVKENIPTAQIIKFEETDWLEALATDKLDAVIYDYAFAVAEMQDYPRLHIVKNNVISLEYSIGLSRGNDDMLDKINKVLSEIMKTEAYKKLLLKYAVYFPESED